jgi:hypothetical protein
MNQNTITVISLSVMLLVPMAGCAMNPPSAANTSTANGSPTPTQSDNPNLRVLNSYPGNITVEIKYYSNNTTHVQDKMVGVSANTYDELPDRSYWVEISVNESTRIILLEPYHETTVEVTESGDVQVQTTEYNMVRTGG